jgi:hypothetical protein
MISHILTLSWKLVPGCKFWWDAAALDHLPENISDGTEDDALLDTGIRLFISQYMRAS